MNNQLIEKVIKSNSSTPCPEITYENPLLDRNVAARLSRSFVNILSDFQQNSNINNNLRYSALANIRKICRIEPENHVEIDENITKSLSEVYVDEIKDTQENCFYKSPERSLDEFLMKTTKEVDLKSKYEVSMNPEVIQALLNLSNNSTNLDFLSQNVLHWNVSNNKKNLTLVKNLWNSPQSGNAICNISIKIKSEIETILLDLCHSALTEPDLQMNVLFAENNVLKNLMKKCSQSPQCFQICSRILHYLFVNTNYNEDIKDFTSNFVQNIKSNCSNISVLYPEHLSSIVVLLDIDLNIIQNLQSNYVEKTMSYLKMFNETDLVMLLSHFPYWFHYYCNLKNC